MEVDDFIATGHNSVAAVFIQTASTTGASRDAELLPGGLTDDERV